MSSELTIDVEGEGACEPMDVSATGMAIASQGDHGIGQVLNLEFEIEDHVYKGRVCVQSAQNLHDGRTRYGLLCIAEGDAEVLSGMGFPGYLRWSNVSNFNDGWAGDLDGREQVALKRIPGGIGRNGNPDVHAPPGLTGVGVG